MKLIEKSKVATKTERKKEIFEQVDLGRGKTQAYSYIDKIQKYAKDLYDDKYH